MTDLDKKNVFSSSNVSASLSKELKSSIAILSYSFCIKVILLINSISYVQSSESAISWISQTPRIFAEFLYVLILN